MDRASRHCCGTPNGPRRPTSTPTTNVVAVGEPGARHHPHPRHVAARVAGPDRAAFKRADLNLWVPSASGGWRRACGKPRSARSARSRPAGSSSRDGTRTGRSGSASGPRSTTWASASRRSRRRQRTDFWDRARRAGCGDRKLQLRVGATLASHVPPDLATAHRVCTAPREPDVDKGARSEINQGRVWHPGEHALSEQVGRAVPYHTKSGMGLSAIRSPGDITLARCLVVAVGELVAVAPTARARWSCPRRRTLCKAARAGSAAPEILSPLAADPSPGRLPQAKRASAERHREAPVGLQDRRNRVGWYHGAGKSEGTPPVLRALSDPK